MGKKKENKKKRASGSGKPKHSLDVNRRNGAKSSRNKRSASTVRRLNMYNTKPKRNRKGKVLKHEFQSKDLPNTCIHPDRRWFAPTRVVSQKDLEKFREEMQSRMSNTTYCFILK